MKTWKVILLAVASFLLGTLLPHLRTVHAQNPNFVHITAVPMTGPGSGSGVVSGTVIGFSCVPDTTNKSGTPGDGICYIASR